MSKFYTVNTTNAFAALDLSDDGNDTIQPISKAPKPKEEAPVTAKEEEAQSPKQGRGGRGGARGGGRGGIRAPAGTDATADKPNNRPRGDFKGKRGGREGFVPRDATKKVFDRKTNPQGMKKLDANDPDAETLDVAVAGEIVADDLAENSSDAPVAEEPKLPAGPKTITMDQYMKSVQSEFVEATVNVSKTDNSDLNREIADAGFQALDKKKENPLDGGVAPGSKKSSKSAAPAGQDFFSYAGKFQSIRPKNDRFDDKERKPREPKQEKVVTKEAPTDDDFPTIG